MAVFLSVAGVLRFRKHRLLAALGEVWPLAPPCIHTYQADERQACQKGHEETRERGRSAVLSWGLGRATQKKRLVRWDLKSHRDPCRRGEQGAARTV